MNTLKSLARCIYRWPISRLFVFAIFTAVFSASALNTHATDKKPNIILMMADDLGYGDTGFNGHEIIQTPHLDQMAKDGIKLSHFYASGPVCSPTRGTFLTGRHYFRYGVFTANMGHLPTQELTMSEFLKQHGYTTGHFGKWHLGTLNENISAKGAKRKPKENFSPPWLHGYDTSFVTESAIQTWDPGLGKRAVDNPFYEDGIALDGNDKSLKGGAAKVVVDRAIPFIEKAAEGDTPFLAVVWFHAPHKDVKAGPEYLAKYPGHDDAAHYYGCITEMDDQVGRIRKKLAELKIDDNTLVLFTSDNGPENLGNRVAGTTAGLRERKRSLYDGGVRVPTVVAWPGKLEANKEISTVMSTLDLLPTVSAVVSEALPAELKLDGENVWPLLTKDNTQRTKSVPFFYSNRASLVKDKYKLVTKDGKAPELYNLTNDWSEKNNIAKLHPERVKSMFRELKATYHDIKQSHTGKDYADSSYQPVDAWKTIKTFEVFENYE